MDGREPLDQPIWKNRHTNDAFERMDFTVRCALHHGTRAIRMHLVGTAAIHDPAIVTSVYDAYDGLQVSCCVLLPVCAALEKALADYGYTGKVVLGHCSANSPQSPAVQQDACTRLGRIGNVFVVANPYTNLGLEDRRGSSRPYSDTIATPFLRTTRWRGLTLVQGLRAAGVMVVAASDNVRDHLYPDGDYHMLAVWKEALSSYLLLSAAEIHYEYVLKYFVPTLVAIYDGAMGTRIDAELQQGEQGLDLQCRT